MEKYKTLKEEYSEVTGGPPAAPVAPAKPVAAAVIPMYATPPGGYGHPVVGQPQGGGPIWCVPPPVIPDHEAPDYLAQAILVTIFCCLPFGIVGLVKSTDCRYARLRGDRESAVRNSKEAKKFSTIGLGCGIVIIIAVSMIEVFSFCLRNP